MQITSSFLVSLCLTVFLVSTLSGCGPSAEQLTEVGKIGAAVVEIGGETMSLTKASGALAEGLSMLKEDTEFSGPKKDSLITEAEHTVRLYLEKIDGYRAFAEEQKKVMEGFKKDLPDVAELQAIAKAVMEKRKEMRSEIDAIKSDAEQLLQALSDVKSEFIAEGAAPQKVNRVKK